MGKDQPTVTVMIRLAALICAMVVSVLLWGCQSSPDEPTQRSEAADTEQQLDVATFAGGCFWCMQPPFDELDGVDSTVVGYTGGDMEEPTYEQVSSGQTDHVEAVEIRFDADRISYGELLEVFWRSIDPTDDGGQFADRGDHYRTFLFYHDDDQKQAARDSRQTLDEQGPFDDPVVTEIEPASTFWIAEDYHQEYYRKNPEHYQQYYEGSGRAGFLRETWGDE